MAVAIAKVAGVGDYTAGNRKVKRRTLTFSGNYATNGESITAAQVGLHNIEEVYFGGVAAAATPTTAVMLGAVIATDGLSVRIRSYDAAASAAPFIEKDDSEAYITGQVVRATFVGRGG